MSGLIQRMLPSENEAEEVRAGSGPLCPKVLVVSVDVRFYADILSAVNSRVWQVDWARSVDAALAVCRFGSVPIVLYDENLPWADWRDAFDRLRRLPNRPHVLLAARSVDEQLWRTVLHHRGYDVVPRSADSTEMKQALRFAWIAAQGRDTEQPVTVS